MYFSTEFVHLKILWRLIYVRLVDGNLQEKKDNAGQMKVPVLV